MSRGQANGTGIAFERRFWCRIGLVAGAILIGSVSSVPSASATLVGEAADVVGSTVKSVDAAPNAAPSLPSPTPPATPRPPVAPPAPVAPQAPATPQAPAAPQAPAGPQAPAAPRTPVKSQTEATPTPSPSPPSSGVKVPSVDGIAGAARNSIGSVTSTGRETTQRAAAPAASARNAGSRVSTPPNGPDAVASKATPSAIGTASSAPPSITAAEVAALQRWFARVWPAIPLGGGGAGRGWAAGVIGDLFRPAAAATARLLSLVPLVARAAGDSPFVGHPGTANAPQLALPNAAPADGKKIIYLVVLAALLALLGFTIWREFRSALRPGVR